MSEEDGMDDWAAAMAEQADAEAEEGAAEEKTRRIWGPTKLMCRWLSLMSCKKKSLLRQKRNVNWIPFWISRLPFLWK